MGDVQGNALGGIGGLLAAFGVVEHGERDRVEAALADALSRRALAAELVELRFGTATIRVGAACAQLLKFEREAVLAEVQGEVGDVVQRLAVRVAAS